MVFNIFDCIVCERVTVPNAYVDQSSTVARKTTTIKRDTLVFAFHEVVHLYFIFFIFIFSLAILLYTPPILQLLCSRLSPR